MTRPRWEYLRLIYVYAKTTPRTWSQTYYAYRPDQPNETFDSKDLDFIAYVNGLGNEGWEMVSESVMETTLIGQVYGWETVGHPVRIVWTFKRFAE